MRHRGRCEGGVFVSSEFSEICHDHPNNNQMTAVFGYVYKGMETIMALNLNVTGLHPVVAFVPC